MKNILVFLIALSTFYYAWAQDVKPQNVFYFNLGNATHLSYSRNIKIIPNTYFNIGAGIMGLFQDPDYKSKYSIPLVNQFYGRGMIYFINTSVINRIYFIENRSGIQITAGLHNRIITRFSLKEDIRGFYTMDIPRKTKFEPQALFLGGWFYSPPISTIEMGFNAGVCIDQFDRPGYTEFLWDFYMGVKF